MPPPFAPFAEENRHDAASEALLVYTIGHGNQESGAFVALLRCYGIATVIDVRSAPYSRYVPHFNQEAVRELLHAAGVRYVWAGDTLGGRPSDPACYRAGVVRAGEVDYAAMARQSWYREGVAQMIGQALCGLTAIMCSEEDPRRCHRHRLIEPSLREQGCTVLHIRADGRLETIDVNGAEDAAPSPQLMLTGFA